MTGQPISKPRLLLHAGTHKTGTTALQTYFCANRAQLRDRGIAYPQLSSGLAGVRDQHHIWAHALAGISPKLDADGARQISNEWLADAQANGLTTLVSAEPLWRHVIGDEVESDWIAKRDCYLASVADLLSDFDVETILVFRRPHDYVRSLYLEHISAHSGGVDLSFPAFVKRCEQTLLRYGENALLFVKHFGNVTTLVYEDLQNESISASFMKAIGLYYDGLEDPGIVRKSSSVVESILLNEIRVTASFHMAKRQSVELLECLKKEPDVQAYLEENSYRDLWKDSQEIEAIYRTWEKQHEILVHKFDLKPTQLRPTEPVSVRPQLQPVTSEVKKVIAIALSSHLNKMRAGHQKKTNTRRRDRGGAKKKMSSRPLLPPTFNELSASAYRVLAKLLNKLSGR